MSSDRNSSLSETTFGSLDSERIQDREAKIAQHKRQKVIGKKIVVTADTPLPKKFPKNASEEEFLKGALGDNFIFSALDEKEMGLLIDVMVKEKVEEGKMIIKQGDVGDFFYIVQEGTVNFIINEEQHVGSCGACGSFGELALLYDAPRAATCVADTDCILWKVDQDTFRFLLAKNAEMYETNTAELLKKIPLFKDLSAATLQKFSNALTTVPFKPGDRIVKKGDVGEVFYLISEGEVKIHDIGHGTEHADNILKPGEWFGERSLLTGEPRAASATAITDVITLAMDRETFEQVIGGLEHVLQHEMKKDQLEVLPCIANSKLFPAEIDSLVEKMVEHRYKKGEYVAKVGEEFPAQIVIIRNGKVSVYSADGGIHVLKGGDAYGAQTIVEDRGTDSPDTVVCDEDTDCWILMKTDIQEIAGDMSRLGGHAAYVDTHKEDKRVIEYKDIKKHSVLGQGAFGLVFLVSIKEEDPPKPYALKMMDKRELIENSMVNGTVREKNILASLDHPFILPLIASFQDEEHCFLLLSLLQGGELFNVIHGDSRRKFLPNDASVFYAACVLDALSHFHNRLICYRDLKPENILIDSDGYCVIVDLGFAKIVTSKTYTMCGTPEYLAPEIITSKGHDKAVDWWAFGVLVYEMLCGKSPFYKPGTDQLYLFKNIVRVRYSCPEHMKKEGQDFISKLLVKKTTARLGNMARGDLDLRDHPWFASMDFKRLTAKKYKAPWIPKVKNAFDSSHFEEIQPHVPGGRRKKLTAAEQALFSDF